MATIKEVIAKRKKIHDKLTAAFYPLKRAGLVDGELQAIFDASHLENELARVAEIKTASDYIKPEPTRDLETEIDEIKLEIEELKSPK